MPSDQYPDWGFVRRFLVDGYPVVLLEKDGRRLVVSEGRHANLIEFLLNAAKPSEPWAEERNGVKWESVDHIFHQGFTSGEGWAVSDVFYGHLVPPEEFEEHRQDPEFIKELERYRQRFGRELEEPIWDVRVSSGDWRGAANYIPQRSIQKIIELEAAFQSNAPLPEGLEPYQEERP